jgi:hypothetical protein
VGSVSYYNGEAAFLLIPFRVGIYLAGSCLVNPALRGLVLAGVLCSMEVVLMQSRGAMVATAVSLPVFLVFLSSGQRLRSLLTLAPVVAALFIASPRLNNVYVESLTGRFPASAIDRVAFYVRTTATAARLYGLVWRLVDRCWRPRRIVVLFSQGVGRKRARGQPGRLERATVGSVRNERLERWGAAPLPWRVRYRAVHALAGGLEGLRLAPRARGRDA